MNQDDINELGAELGRRIAETGDTEALRYLARRGDVPRAIEKVRAAIDDFAGQAGLVEVDLVVGEEPEEGVEVEVRGVAWDESLERPDTFRRELHGRWSDE